MEVRCYGEVMLSVLFTRNTRVNMGTRLYSVQPVSMDATE